MKRRIAEWMRRWADRLDRKGAPKAIGWYFTFEPGRGIDFHDEPYGCRLWYLGDDEYEKAHTEARNALEGQMRALGDAFGRAMSAMFGPAKARGE